MADPWYRWPKGLRQAIMERDGHHCRIRLLGCKHTPDCYRCATVVDHILPVLSGGAWFDPANLRAACSPCNQSRRDFTQKIIPTYPAPERW